MKRILCVSMVLILLLTACSAPVQQLPPSTEQDGDDGYGVYEFTFHVECLSGWTFEDWNFIYTYKGKEIQSGYQMLFSLGLFSFHSVQVDVIEQGNPQNVFHAAFPIAICDGGYGETEITVTDTGGKTTIYKITCGVTQVGKQKG